MSKSKFLSLMLTVVMLLGTATLFSCESDTPSGGTSDTTPSDIAVETTPTDGADQTTPAETTPAETTPAETTPAPYAPQTKLDLTALTFDDAAYSVSLDGSEKYTVSLPAGRSRIPLITANAGDGATVEIIQAVIPDSKTEGDAKITVSDGAQQKVYTVTFKRDASLGFHLQYDDYYTFTPNYALKAGESFTFKSSNEAVATVTAAGVVRVVAISDTAVSITAEAGGAVVDTLNIDKAIKAPIDIICLTGQSNADGVKGDASESIKPLPGTAYYIERDGSSIRTLENGRKGFGPALAKTWYELTGTKVTIVQGAKDGSRISSWVGGGSNYANFVAKYRIVKNKYSSATSNYEIRKTGYVWHHGETDMSKGMSGEEYITKFTQVHNNILKDTDCTFGLFNIVRSTGSLTSQETKDLGLQDEFLPIRAYQYTMNSDFPDVMLSTRFTETANVNDGYIYSDRVHFSQKGYNALGPEIANTMFNWLCVGADRTPTELEVMAYNSRNKLSEGAVLGVKAGETAQLASIVLPIYTTQDKITYSSSSDKITVNKYGLIKVAAGLAADTTATITVEGGGFTKKLTVKVVGNAAEVPTAGEAVEYIWDFDDLKEKNTGTELKVSAKSTDPQYKLEGGKIIISNRTTDFDMGLSFTLTHDRAWEIEFKGIPEKCNLLFGTSESKYNIVYFTPFNTYNSFRLVDKDNTIINVKFGSAYNESHQGDGKEHVWRAVNDPATSTISLYMDGELVSTETTSAYNVTVTNLFGRYTASTNVCYCGTVDYIKVKTTK